MCMVKKIGCQCVYICGPVFQDSGYFPVIVPLTASTNVHRKALIRPASRFISRIGSGVGSKA